MIGAGRSREGGARAIPAAVFLLLAAFALPAAAGPLRIKAPARAAGDGTTPVPIRIELRGRGALADVVLEASAGTVREAEPQGGAVAMELIPARVASETVVRLTARARAGNRRLRARGRIVLTPAPLSPGTRGGDGPLGLAGPARLLLGVASDADITLAAGAESAVLEASAGKVGELAPKSGKLAARYEPPESRRPQVVIVAATAASGSYDWQTIALYGKGRVSLEGEPDAAVTVDVGGVEFGPVRLDPKGRAELAIFAPPGEKKAHTVAVDPSGNRSRGTLELGTPQTPHLLATCPAPGDRIRAFAVAPDGTPLSGATLQLAAGRGELAAAREVEPGVYEALYAPSKDAKVGDRVELTATLQGSEISGACTAVLEGQRPSGLRVELEKDRYRAGSGRRLGVTIELEYPSELPRLTDQVRVFADLGAVGEVSRATDESFRTVWILPDEHGGREEAEIRAAMVSDPVQVAAASVSLVAGEPAHLELELRALGSKDAVAAKVRDRFGNPVSVDALQGQATGGSLGAFHEIGVGSYEASYVPAEQGAADRITVRVPGLLEQTLRVGGDSGSTAEGPAPAPALALYGRVGYLDNLGKVNGALFSGGVTFRPPVLARRLGVGVEVGFYSSRKRAVIVGEQDVVAEVVGAPIVARLSYEHPVGSAVLYGGAAGGALLLDAQVSARRTGAVQIERIRPAIGLFAGGTVSAGRGRLVAELGYLRGTLDQDEIAGNAAGFYLSGGYLFDLL